MSAIYPAVYDCSIFHEAGKWRGRVRTSKDLQAHCTAGEIRRVIYAGPPFATQAEAAADARDWCRRKGILDYFGPVTSGMGCRDITIGPGVSI